MYKFPDRKIIFVIDRMYHRKEKYLIHVKKMTKTDVFVLQKYRNAVIFLKRKIMYSTGGRNGVEVQTGVA